MLRFDPSYGLSFSLFSVLFIVSFWQLSRGWTKLIFAQCFGVFPSFSLMSLHQRTIFTLCDAHYPPSLSFCPFKPTHVYFSSIMIYLFHFHFSYLYCTATSPSVLRIRGYICMTLNTMSSMKKKFNSSLLYANIRSPS